MNIKLKICGVCRVPGRLWKSTPPMCKNCAMIAYANKAKIKPPKPLAQTNDDKVAKAFKIAPISPKRAQELKLYRKERDDYFKEHPVCEFPECNSREITLHHKRGRCGVLLTDKRYFCSLCPKHHTYVNEHNDEAKKVGLVESRLAII